MKHGLRDWDCVEALDIPAMLGALDHIHTHGTLPPALDSKEDQNQTGASGVPASTIDRLRREVTDWAARGRGKGLISHTRPVALLDGFLLYGNNVKAVREKLDIRMLLRVGYAKAKERREARSGYVTLEGFWEDPPGYVDRIVWPNYVEDHGFMFEEGDVEGRVDEGVLRELGVKAQPRLDMDMGEAVGWAVGIIEEELEKRVHDGGRVVI